MSGWIKRNWTKTPRGTCR